ncbi:GNAT family protein [Niveibacterium umoris]|uniref:Aminoglycoside 6'-N-acetyltransferase n=1 Tax=Niveibacterium umoris TaxID=1193620 RepID=A0A840BCZ1_9RHOO|nr:GNAT family N-acetyltransferase [Niveibacterium umoris]MBB4010955.1 aminoglycoside 6'-N-acetyltransferase [Niveibacterium umoris]
MTSRSNPAPDAPAPTDTLPRVAARVVLRRLRGSDLHAFQAYRGDPEVGRYQGWSPMPDANAASFLAEMSAAPLLRQGEWVQLGIAALETDVLLGDIGLFLSPDGAHAEIGFTLARAAQGQGIAREAVREAIDMVFARTAVTEVRAITDARNLASVGLLQRLGFTLQARCETTFRGEPCVELVYRLGRTA